MSENTESVECPHCKKMLTVNSSCFGDGRTYECVTCKSKLHLFRDSHENGYCTSDIGLKAQRSESVEPPDVRSNQSSSVPSVQHPAHGIGFNSSSDPQSELSLDALQLNQIITAVLSGLRDELPNAVARALREQSQVNGGYFEVESIKKAAQRLQDQSTQFLTELTNNTRKEMKNAAALAVKDCTFAIATMTDQLQDSLRRVALPELKRALDDIANELHVKAFEFQERGAQIANTATSETNRAIQRLKNGIKKVEAEQMAYQLPSFKKKDRGAFTELTETQLLEFGTLMAKAALVPESVSRLTEGLRTLQQRERLLEDLPSLFDFLDAEIQSCDNNPEDQQSVSIKKVLERLRKRMTAWMSRNHIEAFPKVGDTFGYQTQECIANVPVGPSANEADGRVAAVEVTGYRFTDSEYPLRRARVTCYKKSPKP